MYLKGAEVGQPMARELKETAESVLAADYDGRTVVELLQNGHDAHDPARFDGRLEFFLDETEGEHGVLYAANGGNPLNADNFDSMCLIALSTKQPNEGIGNKGVGFKSVLQLADCPEVFSSLSEGSGRFDGFRFRFGRPSDFDELAARSGEDRLGLADELRKNVSALKVTVPLADTPEVVDDFARRGFSTVIRLPLRSSAAREHAKEQLAQLADDEVPFHLFLFRVAEIALRVRNAGGERTQRLTRTTRPRPGTGTLSIKHVDLAGRGEYLLFQRTVGEAAMRAAILASRADNTVGSSWAKWEGEGTVSVAVPLGAPLEHGRVNAFLPLGANTRYPLAALVNGPFFARLDRRDLQESVHLNDVLFNEVAELCADALIAAYRGELTLPVGVRLDLVCWSEGWLDRLVVALESRGHALRDLPVLPALGHDEGVPLTEALLWSSSGAVFTPEAVTAAGESSLMRHDLHEHHIRRVRALSKACGLPVDVEPEHVAEFAETLAADLLARGAAPNVWADFYDELSDALPEVKAVVGRRVIVTEDGVLHAADEDHDPMIYFGRVRGEGGELPELPEAVRARLAFMPGDISWVDGNRKQRRGRRWLEGVVREYRTDAVLELLGKVMRDAEDDEIRSACLRFAFALWLGTPAERRHNALGQADLLVPTRAGWRVPGQAYFGTGWRGPKHEVDRLLAELVDAAAAVSDQLEQIGERVLDKDFLRSDAVDDERTFFETLGVNHGLVPWWTSTRNFHVSGKQLKNPHSVPNFPADFSAKTQDAWRELAARRATKPSFDSTKYQISGLIAFLPGQEDWAEFSHDTRRLYAQLVLRGLDVWPDSALKATFQASTDSVKPTWPSFAAAFLHEADWVLQTTPGERSRQFFAPLRAAWWVGDTDTPDYLSAAPAAWRSLLTDRVRERLTWLGARFWDVSTTAADRLAEINEVVGRQGPRAAIVRTAYEQAWRDLFANGGPDVQVPHAIVVTSRGALSVVDLDLDGPAVYTDDRPGATETALLAQTPVPVLAVRVNTLAAQVRRALVADGVTRIKSCSDAAVRVLVDGVDPLDQPGRPLADLGGDWLPLLVDAIAEQRRHVLPVSRVPATSTADPLRGDIEVVLADSIIAVIDGHQVDHEFAPDSIRVSSPDRGQVIVTLRGSGDRWSVLQSAAAALADFRGGLAIAASLRLALIDLAARCGDGTPEPADVAAVLKMPLDELHALVGDSAGNRFALTPVLELIACLDVAAAEELQGVRDRIADQDEVRTWLIAHGFDADRILTLARRNDLLDATRQLDIALARANAGLRALGLNLLHNGDGHQHQFDAYLQRHRSEIRDRLRDRFARVFREGGALDEYVRLRELPGLEPDRAWLDTHWNLSADLLRDRVDSWLGEIGSPLEPGRSLPPVDELRERGRREVAKRLDRARIVVDAWLHRNAGGSGKRPGDAVDNIEAMVQAGLLDFRRPLTDDVIEWLRKNEQWPEGMPATTELRPLHLEDADLDAARDRLDSEQHAAKSQGDLVQYGGRSYSADQESRAELVEALRASIPPEVLGTDPAPQESGLLPSATATGKTSSGGAPGWRAPSVSTSKTKLIGLAGEIVVGEWLRRKYELPPEDTWCSGYRSDHLADGKGDDRLGYDFLVKTNDKTILYEVKSTVDDLPQFALGESEVRRANDLAENEEYRIVFVTHVLDQAKIRLRVLPNPFSPGGMATYHVVGRSFRLGFAPGTP
ncbi:sacsin N-terminal ATP-binding-like domain-containing protein [Saccharothrix hoggarensis]|uniref:Sacsin N-terminal ATP-binding-like domain-containing protein n=1 Tax=Saccharothrix hoggarensis TaxID=913853 RepID=A0ABW3QFL6_9PSEU